MTPVGDFFFGIGVEIHDELGPESQFGEVIFVETIGSGK